MKIEIKPTPSANDCRTLLLRHIPENEDDEKAIKKLAKVLVGMNVVSTFPEVKGKTTASLLFTKNTKRAGAK